jgi:hypothetical protein
MLNFIQGARAERGKLAGEKLDNFIQEKMRSAISGEKISINGKTQFILNWNHDGIQLCRNSYAIIFGISKHQLDLCSAAFKLSETKRVSAISHKELKDSQVHEYTFIETEQMMKENLFRDVIGIVYIFF